MGISSGHTTRNYDTLLVDDSIDREEEAASLTDSPFDILDFKVIGKREESSSLFFFSYSPSLSMALFKKSHSSFFSSIIRKNLWFSSLKKAILCTSYSC